MSVWHYLKNGAQYGPVELHELKQLAANGTILPTDMIWKEGLPEWVQASKAKGLFPEPGGAVPHAAPAVAQYQAPAAAYQAPAQQYAAPAQAVGYYAAAGSLPSRAAQALRMLPPPSGSTQDWPLDDAHLRQLQVAGKHRRTMVLMSGYFRLMFAFFGILSIFVIGVLITAGGDVSRILSEPQAWIPLVLLFGTTVCAGLSHKAVERAQAWAPITMLACHAAYALYLCYAIYQLIEVMGVAGPQMGLALILVLGWTVWMIAGAYFCYRAIAAIPQFLAQPVWCQEALVSANL